MKASKVYLIGAGPGRPDLITVRGMHILKEADMVIYDYLVDSSILNQVRPGAELISCEQLGKKRYLGRSLIAQGKINDLMVKGARQGRRVVRLKNGDVSIFSRAREEIEALLKNKIGFEIVPGVTAASTAAAFTGAMLTDREYSSSAVLLTGRESSRKKKTGLNWKAIASFNTIVIYMGLNNLPRLVSKLIDSGKSGQTPVVAVSKAGYITQDTVRARLEDIVERVKEKAVQSPSIFIIGVTAGLERDFNWLRKNKRILFTGLSKERFFSGASYCHLPMVKIEPLDDYREFDDYLKEIRYFDWIVFASRYGVGYFFERIRGLGGDSRLLASVKIAAIGNSTRLRLLDFGISADLMPRKESSEGLIEEFHKLELIGKRIFLPRSDISDKGLEREFKKLGARVNSSFAYRNVMPDDLPDIDLNGFDEIVFTSPSTVRNFKKRYENVPRRVRIRCIGDVTLKEAARCRFLD